MLLSEQQSVFSKAGNQIALQQSTLQVTQICQICKIVKSMKQSRLTSHTVCNTVQHAHSANTQANMHALDATADQAY